LIRAQCCVHHLTTLRTTHETPLHSVPTFSLGAQSTRAPQRKGVLLAPAIGSVATTSRSAMSYVEESAATPLLPVVLLHGLLSTTREFGLISLPLRSRGVPLITPTIEGYTEGDRSQFARWQTWVDAAVVAIRTQVDVTRPFVLGGLCTGGMLAAAVAARGEFNVRTLVMMAPSFGYDGWSRTHSWNWRRLGYFLRVDRFISVRERPPYGIKNQKIRAWVDRDMQQRAISAAGPSSLPLWAIGQSEKLMAHVKSALPALRVPTVMIHSRLDEICTLDRVRRALETMPPGANRLVVLEDSYHMITMDNERHHVTAELLTCAGKIERNAAAAVESTSGASALPPARELAANDNF
jgi:carboxylesterase